MPCGIGSDPNRQNGKSLMSACQVASATRVIAAGFILAICTPSTRASICTCRRTGPRRDERRPCISRYRWRGTPCRRACGPQRRLGQPEILLQRNLGRYGRRKFARVLNYLSFLTSRRLDVASRSATQCAANTPWTTRGPDSCVGGAKVALERTAGRRQPASTRVRVVAANA